MNAFSRILSALSEKRVKFIVVGGVAVNAHGFQRFTHDLDLVIDLSRDNLEAALKVLEQLGFEPRMPVAIGDFLDAKLRETWIKTKDMMVFSLTSQELNGMVVDIFAEEPFNFAETLSKSFMDDLGGQTEFLIPFLDLDSLIEMKEQAGRPNDLRDVEELKLLRDDH